MLQKKQTAFIGAILDLYPRSADGGYSAEGFQMAIGILIVLHLIALIWYWIAGAIWQDCLTSAPMEQISGIA